MNYGEKMRLMQILQAPCISEKASRNQAYGQYTFKVLLDATKEEIKQAVEMLFEVKVTRVQTLNVKGKRKSFGRVQGKRSDWKKAHVCLQPGDEINLMGE